MWQLEQFLQSYLGKLLSETAWSITITQLYTAMVNLHIIIFNCEQSERAWYTYHHRKPKTMDTNRFIWKRNSPLSHLSHSFKLCYKEIYCWRSTNAHVTTFIILMTYISLPDFRNSVWKCVVLQLLIQIWQTVKYIYFFNIFLYCHNCMTFTNFILICGLFKMSHT